MKRPSFHGFFSLTSGPLKKKSKSGSQPLSQTRSSPLSQTRSSSSPPLPGSPPPRRQRRRRPSPASPSSSPPAAAATISGVTISAPTLADLSVLPSSTLTLLLHPHPSRSMPSTQDLPSPPPSEFSPSSVIGAPSATPTLPAASSPSSTTHLPSSSALLHSSPSHPPPVDSPLRSATWTESDGGRTLDLDRPSGPDSMAATASRRL